MPVRGNLGRHGLSRSRLTVRQIATISRNVRVDRAARAFLEISMQRTSIVAVIGVVGWVSSYTAASATVQSGNDRLDAAPALGELKLAQASVPRRGIGGRLEATTTGLEPTLSRSRSRVDAAGSPPGCVPRSVGRRARASKPPPPGSHPPRGQARRASRPPPPGSHPRPGGRRARASRPPPPGSHPPRRGRRARASRPPPPGSRPTRHRRARASNPPRDVRRHRGDSKERLTAANAKPAPASAQSRPRVAATLAGLVPGCGAIVAIACRCRRDDRKTEREARAIARRRCASIALGYLGSIVQATNAVQRSRATSPVPLLECRGPVAPTRGPAPAIGAQDQRLSCLKPTVLASIRSGRSTSRALVICR